MSTFSIEMNSDNMEAVSDIMDDWQDEMSKHIQEEADKLGISYGAAADVVYLRTRSRWTQEKEDELVSLAKEGKPLPDVLSGEF